MPRGEIGGIIKSGDTEVSCFIVVLEPAKKQSAFIPFIPHMIMVEIKSKNLGKS
jgi:hypothetical protein